MNTLFFGPAIQIHTQNNFKESYCKKCNKYIEYVITYNYCSFCGTQFRHIEESEVKFKILQEKHGFVYLYYRNFSVWDGSCKLNHEVLITPILSDYYGYFLKFSDCVAQILDQNLLKEELEKFNRNFEKEIKIIKENFENVQIVFALIQLED